MCFFLPFTDLLFIFLGRYRVSKEDICDIRTSKFEKIQVNGCSQLFNHCEVIDVLGICALELVKV